MLWKTRKGVRGAREVPTNAAQKMGPAGSGIAGGRQRGPRIQHILVRNYVIYSVPEINACTRLEDAAG